MKIDFKVTLHWKRQIDGFDRGNYNGRIEYNSDALTVAYGTVTIEVGAQIG
jgi:hypothetical protein